MSILEFARVYMARGWNSVPVAFRGKKPSAGDDWQKLRIDESNVHLHFAGALANIGVQLGAASNGLTDIDLDCPEAIVVASAFLPETPSIFGRASAHSSHRLYYTQLYETIGSAALQFKDPEPPKDAKATLVELRIGGGDKGAQTVLPGSMHESGEWITWESDGAPATVDGVLLQRQTARLAAAALVMRRWVNGDRHWQGFTLGGFLCRAGWSEDECAHFVEAAAKGVGDQEWQDRVKAARHQWHHHKATGQGHGLPKLEAAIGEKSARAVAEWLGYHEVEPGWGATLLDPWQKFIVRDFPLDALSHFVGWFIESESRVIGCDRNGLAMAVLAAISGALDHRFRLKMLRAGSWYERPALWVVEVGDPSTKKSPTMRSAVQPLREFETALYHSWKAHCDLIRVKNPDAKDKDLPPPPNRFVVQDTTIEAIGEILANQHRGTLLLRDELAGWIGSMDRYQNAGKGASADRAFWLEAYDGGAFTIDRIKRGSLRIENLSTAVLGGIQPDRLRELADLTSDGLLQRFLPVLLREPDFPIDAAMSQPNDLYRNLVQTLAKLQPATLVMTDDALAEAEGVRRRLHDLERASSGLAPGFQAFVGKLPGVLGRLALILHLTAKPFEASAQPVPVAIIRNAARILEEFTLPHALEFYSIAESAADRLRGVASYILTAGKDRLVPSDFTTNVAALRSLSMWDLNQRVSPLVAGGWLAPEGSGALPRAWSVNPAVHGLFAERRTDEERRKSALAKLMNSPRRPQS